jgi:leader peptidase (prepilin peptidase) / N-methyltransferase
VYSLFAFIFQNSFLFRGVLLFILGAVVGSFLNVVIYRLPIILKQQWKNDAKDVLQLESSTTLEASSDTIGMNSDTNDHNDSLEHKFNLFYPFSHCPLCKTKIRFWTNIPIIGYFLINGRCLHCQSKIAIVYPLVELITAVLFVAVGFFTNSPWLLMAYLAFVSIVICLIVIDYNEMLLPDELTLSLLWLGLLANLNGAVCGSLQSAVIGAFVGYLVLWLVYWLVKLITHKDGMGYGNISVVWLPVVCPYSFDGNSFGYFLLCSWALFG